MGFDLLLTRNKLDHLGGVEIEPEEDCNGIALGQDKELYRRGPSPRGFLHGEVAEVRSVSASDKVLECDPASYCIL